MHLTDQEISAQIEQDRSKFAQRSDAVKEFLRRETAMVRASSEYVAFPRPTVMR